LCYFELYKMNKYKNLQPTRIQTNLFINIIYLFFQDKNKCDIYALDIIHFCYYLL